MTKQTKTIIGIAIVAGLGYWIWSRRKEGKSVIPSLKTTDSNSSKFVGDENFFNARGGKPSRYVVGQYNNQTNQTYVYPEGNIRGGYWVNGTVNAPQGTIFTP